MLSDCAGTPDVILMASGSEVGLCVKAAEELGEKAYVIGKVTGKEGVEL